MKIDFGLSRLFVKLIYLLQGILLKRDNKCPYCAISDYEVVFRKRGIVDICSCRNCSIYWTNPIFRFPKFYGSLYKGEGLTTTLVEMNELEELKSTCFRNTGKDYSLIINWLKGLSSGKRLLEFGSSWGYFLFQAQSEGFEAAGVEISDNRREFGIKHLGVDIRPNLDQLISAGEKFDLIFSAHTLEHLNDLRDIFLKFYDLLSTGGFLVIEVPYLNLAKGSKVFRIMGAVHPLGFCKEFFTKNLPKYGFEATVHLGYKDLIKGYQNKGDILVVICRKKR